MCDFYRNIYYADGGYNITHNGYYFGRFTDLTKALYERDCLVKVNWDIDKYVEAELDYCYVEELLPPFQHTPSYIKVINGRYYVARTVKGKTTYYKGFSLLQEAVKHRDLLIKNDWECEV